MKPIPKSLHTVTVLVKLAKHARGLLIMGDNADRRSIAWAVEFLGYTGTPDTHELAAAALKQMGAANLRECV